MQDFRKLKVWQRSHALTLAIYKATGSFPRDERFELTAQLRSAAAAIPANIAEGCGRGSDRDFARFLQIALGSASEIENHLILAVDLDYLDSRLGEHLICEVQETKRMLSAFLKKLRADS